MKVLVVDDEEIIVRGIIRHMPKLGELDIQAVGACSCAEALEQLEHFRPDLIITDIRMPGPDGFELLREVRDRGLCENCIILTAYEEFEYARRALDLKVIGYLVKPIDWEILDARLRDLSRQLGERGRASGVMERYSRLWSHLLISDLSPVFGKIARYVQKNFARDLTLTQLSYQTGFTESYICTLFKKELDITFLDYVNELRLRQAMETLLERPSCAVRDVASIVGYRSERQLFRLFSAQLGMTPQQFREAHMGGQ